MKLWLLLLIIGASALLLGGISGTVIGKKTVARMRGEHKALFNIKERIILLSIIAVAVGCVLFAVLYKPAAPVGEDMMGDDMMIGMPGDMGLGMNMMTSSDDMGMIAGDGDLDESDFAGEEMVSGEFIPRDEDLTDDEEGDEDEENPADEDAILTNPSGTTGGGAVTARPGGGVAIAREVRVG